MANNIYGVILAGGKGTRMGNVERPKQYGSWREADYRAYH